jgi:uncharacterized repeat protein (TIGR03803 family)
MSFSAGNVVYVAVEETGVAGAIYSITPPSSQGAQWTGEMLYNFTGGIDGSTDGRYPTGVLVGSSGAIYGTTINGGTADEGTVFDLTPPAQTGGAWTESLIWEFQGGADGEEPEAALTAGPNGTFYGTTSGGGAGGLGTVFQLIPPTIQGGAWTKAILYSFERGTGGENPAAAVIVSGTGALYGTTPKGGGTGQGTVYRLLPPAETGSPWTESVVYSFKGTPNDGAITRGAVCMGANGALFGVTEGGGPSNQGTVFELTPPAAAGEPWTETVLHAFSGADGAYPYFGLTLAPSGVLFGTTQSGGPSGNGTLFQIVP